MRQKPQGITCLVGGQYGSEGKGVIVNHLANMYDIHVRTGAPNAGHSFFYKEDKIKMQSIPCGWANPQALCVIGAGGLVNPKIFMEEAVMVHGYDRNITNRVVIDGSCGILDDKFHHREGGIDGEMHKRIGSTGEGVGPAREARIQRDPNNFRLMRDVGLGEFADKKTGLDMTMFHMEGTVEMMNQRMDKGDNIMLEGTQGSALSLIHGPWPYCTSTDTNAAQMCADAGLSPLDVKHIVLVLRTYPIRVAGNSGPMHKEIDWETMSKRLGKEVCERTTVTKKIRRIGEFDWALAKRGVVLNKPTSLAITFMDYIEPECEGTTRWSDLGMKAKAFIYDLERNLGVPVKMIGTGGPKWSVIDLGGAL